MAKKKASRSQKSPAASWRLFETETSAEESEASPPGENPGVRSPAQSLARQRKAQSLYEEAMVIGYPGMRKKRLQQALKQYPEHVDSLIERGMLCDTPTEATEVWTFVRRRGESWELSAIQQT